MLRRQVCSARPAGRSCSGAGASGGSVDLLDLLSEQAPESRDIVRFSLELLPAVLGRARRRGARAIRIGGYAALHNAVPRCAGPIGAGQR